MKDIPVEELVAISPEIYEAALKVGCTAVSVTGKIWPGATAIGAPEAAARFVEFSWLRAAVVNGEAIFEEEDPKRFLDLLIKYGLEDNPTAQPLRQAARPTNTSSSDVSTEKTTVTLSAEVSLVTSDTIQRRAKSAGLSVGRFLDLVFGEIA